MPKVRLPNPYFNFKPHTSHLTPHTSHLTPHTSHLTPHTSHLTPHTSLTPHNSHLTPHTSHLTPLTSHLAPHTPNIIPQPSNLKTQTLPSSPTNAAISSEMGSLAAIVENERFSTAPFQSFQYVPIQHFYFMSCAAGAFAHALSASVGDNAAKGSWFQGVPKRVTVNGAYVFARLRALD